MDEIKNIKKQLKGMEQMLKTRPDNKLIEGYHLAMHDYEQFDNKQAKVAAEIIKKEIDRRGLTIDDQKSDKQEEAGEGQNTNS